MTSKRRCFPSFSTAQDTNGIQSNWWRWPPVYPWQEPWFTLGLHQRYSQPSSGTGAAAGWCPHPCRRFYTVWKGRACQWLQPLAGRCWELNNCKVLLTIVIYSFCSYCVCSFKIFKGSQLGPSSNLIKVLHLFFFQRSWGAATQDQTGGLGKPWKQRIVECPGFKGVVQCHTLKAPGRKLAIGSQ